MIGKIWTGAPQLAEGLEAAVLGGGIDRLEAAVRGGEVVNMILLKNPPA
jgi:hypothetical protein